MDSRNTDFGICVFSSEHKQKLLSTGFANFTLSPNRQVPVSFFKDRIAIVAVAEDTGLHIWIKPLTALIFEQVCRQQEKVMPGFKNLTTPSPYPRGPYICIYVFMCPSSEGPTQSIPWGKAPCVPPDRFQPGDSFAWMKMSHAEAHRQNLLCGQDFKNNRDMTAYVSCYFRCSPCETGI